MCLALLSVGKLDLGIQILSLHPKMSTVYPDISVALSRLVHVIIDLVYRPISPAAKFMPVTTSEASRIKRYTPTANISDCQIDEIERHGKASNSQLPVYFYNEWRKGIQQSETYESALTCLELYLNHVGIHLYLDLKLATKVARIGKHHIVHVSHLLIITNTSQRVVKLLRTHGLS